MKGKAQREKRGKGRKWRGKEEHGREKVHGKERKKGKEKLEIERPSEVWRGRLKRRQN